MASLRPLFHLPASLPAVLGTDECFLKNILDYLHDSSANSLYQGSFSSYIARSLRFVFHGDLLKEMLTRVQFMHLWIPFLFFKSSSLDWGELQETVRDREAWHAAAHGLTKSRT